MTDTEKQGSGSRTLLLLVTGVLLVAFGWILSGDSLKATDPDSEETAEARISAEPEEVATVDGRVITLAEVETQAEEMLEQLDMQRRQLELKLQQERRKVLMAHLDQMVEEELLSREAEARGIDTAALVALEIEGNTEPVDEEAIQSFYEDLRSQRQGLPPLERMRDQIQNHLTQLHSQEARESFLGTLRDKYDVETYLSEPRVEIATAGHPAMGPVDAPVTIVEFSDFECPYCQRVVPTIEQVKKTYGDKVRIVFRQFPLNIHANAQKAAEASLCAGDQGKFWEMHDLMFQEQKQLAVPQLKEKAERLGLDAGEFASCLDGAKFAEQVEEDVRAGYVAGVSSTPTLFVNGQLLTGAQPYPAVAALIDAELEKAGRS